jgi:dolichyl-phosphate-mannose--protein O-mannosyl transferase
MLTKYRGAAAQRRVSPAAPAAYDRSVTSAVLTEPELDAPPPDPASSPRVPDIIRRRLAPGLPADGWQSWIGTGVVVLVGAIIRLVGLSKPPGKIFDEIYYATEGHDLLVHGVEWSANNKTGDFVVHPPLGKWLIGLGEWIFGYNEFGWRIAAAVAGITSILIMVRMCRRLFGSTMIGCAGGLLMALDGLHFVLSRSALLDIFLMTFILAAFAALVMDRDQRRLRWLRALENGLDPTARGNAGKPPFAVPWWRLLAAVLIGCAMSVKWSALWYFLIFVALIYIWEAGARRSAGVRYAWRDTMIDETGWMILFGVIFTAVYLTSWTGWFLSDAGYDRHWLANAGRHEYPIVGPLRNLYQYHYDAMYFHDHLTTKHTYQSWPWQWLLLGRPVAFYWSSAGGCGAASCAAEVLLLGTPVLWWSFIPALIGVIWFGISRRDWRAPAILLGVAAGIVPWFPYEADERTMFYFYVLPAEPFLIMAVCYCLGAMIKGRHRPGQLRTAGGTEILEATDRRIMASVFAGAYVFAVAVIFAYFYPIYVGESIPYAQWFARMWLGSRWI